MLYETEFNNLKATFKRYEQALEMNDIEDRSRYNITHFVSSGGIKFQFWIREYKDKWEFVFNCNARPLNGTSRWRKPSFYLNVRATPWALFFKTQCSALCNADLTLYERATLLQLIKDFQFIENRYYKKLEQEKTHE